MTIRPLNTLKKIMKRKCYCKVEATRLLYLREDEREEGGVRWGGGAPALVTVGCRGDKVDVQVITNTSGDLGSSTPVILA